MFMGADVTNFGGGGAEQRSSVAAVVGSYDLNFAKYAVRLSEQKNANESRQSQEIVLDLAEMSALLIATFRKSTRVLPKRIVFYRDGVDSGQFQRVLDYELAALLSACERVSPGYRPKITIVIAQKRHHVRFFPIHDADKSGRHSNIPSGSVVSTQVTNKSQFDFYLCSHEAIQAYIEYRDNH